MGDGGEIRIVVTDRLSGAPVAGAEVAVFLCGEAAEGGVPGKERDELLRGVSDGGGLCVLSVDPPPAVRTRVLAVVRARGCEEWRAPELRFGSTAPAEGPPSPFLPAAEGVRIEVRLERGPTLEGIVTDGAGAPLEGAAIGLVLSTPRACSWPHAFGVSRSLHWPPPCRTDARGRFEWLSFPLSHAEADPSARFVLLVEKAGFVPGMVQAVESLPRDSSGVIPVRIALEAGAALEVLVRGPDGRPARGAVVTVRSRPVAGQPVCVDFDQASSTDGSGRCVLRGLGPAARRVEVAMAGCAPFARDLDRPVGGGPPLEILLEEGADLPGRVLDRNGAPVAGTRVFAVVEGSGKPGSAPVRRGAVTDAEGGFRIEGLPRRGRVEVRCEPNILATVDLPSDPLLLREPGLAVLHVELVADEDGSRLGEGGCITFAGPGLSSLLEPDAGGRFLRADLPAGRYELRADLPGRAVAAAEVDLPEGGLPSPVVLRVARGGRVRGRVADAAGAPVAGAEVRAFGAHPFTERRTRSGADGSYDLPGLDPRTCIVATAPGLALRAQPLSETGTAEAPVLLDLTMRAGARITGTVRRGSGEAVAGAAVALLFPGAGQAPFALPSAVTDGEGRFTLEHVPEGEFLVAAGEAVAAIRTRHGGEFEVALTAG